MRTETSRLSSAPIPANRSDITSCNRHKFCHLDYRFSVGAMICFVDRTGSCRRKQKLPAPATHLNCARRHLNWPQTNLADAGSLVICPRTNCSGEKQLVSRPGTNLPNENTNLSSRDTNLPSEKQLVPRPDTNPFSEIQLVPRAERLVPFENKLVFGTGK